MQSDALLGQQIGLSPGVNPRPSSYGGVPKRKEGSERVTLSGRIGGELQVVWLTLKHFLPKSGGAAVNVLSDNATTVAYINKEGVTQSPCLCRLALQVSTWCREHPVASHFSGSKNVLADAPSKGKHHHPTEWSMHKVTEGPSVLLSVLSQTSSGSNALTQNWEQPTIQPHTKGIEETGCNRQPVSY